MKQALTQFAICTHNEGCDDLDLLKIYQVLPDENAAQDDYIRVIDESGEDYLYPKSYFTLISLDSSDEKSLLPLFKQKYSNPA